MVNREEHMAAYVKLLQSHDWAFGWSDDHRVWTAGRDSLAALQTAQKLIDPDCMVWNNFAPEEYRVALVKVGP